MLAPDYLSSVHQSTDSNTLLIDRDWHASILDCSTLDLSSFETYVAIMEHLFILFQIYFDLRPKQKQR
jgi:hypothetical protein